MMPIFQSARSVFTCVRTIICTRCGSFAFQRMLPSAANRFWDTNESTYRENVCVESLRRFIDSTPVYLANAVARQQPEAKRRE